ncbi:zinc finger protein 236-like [Nylanderia fulva]|uniref:zinc finger protein 236-like n=1 Tax=Nylanderia fulva TaxID=613905 RepID=UPI0010FBA185|nr:zinc finger protein 236-like [Nylanderia fulva]
MMGEVIRVSGRPPDVGDILKEAMLSQRFADVALCCPGGQRFLAHRLVLSAASPYLQEVLLAHSKTTAHCEPITVILAETEAPELAALLGFVYTGSATVPRMRLDAFLRAAETLRIRLPPVPVTTTCSERVQADSKQEDVKDVKVNPKYLRCDQYPWYKSGRPSYENPLDRKESRIFPTDGGRDVFRNSETFREVNNPGPSSFGPSCSNEWPIEGFAYRDRTIEDTSAENRDHNSMILVEKNRMMALSSESSFEIYQRDATCLPERPFAEGYGSLDPSERIRLSGYERPQMNHRSERPITDEDVHAAGSGGAGDSYIRRTPDECPYQAASSLSSSQCRTRSFERTIEYGSQTTATSQGEDLSCGESCCRWRTIRRHVANRVTASPWRQIIRPHHSPRIPRSVIPQQRHVDDKIHRKPSTPEPTRSTVISMSPRVHSPSKNTPGRNDGFYAVEVPTSCEMSLNNDTGSRETVGDAPETSVQEIYRSPSAPFAAGNQIAPRSNNEPSFQNVGNTPARLLPVVVNDTVITNAAGYTTPIPVPQTPQKQELSHPISRLCDTIESDEKREASPRMEVAEKNAGEERIARILVNSDNNNNNEAIVSTIEVAQRGRSTTDDHRCDQCGKTFVTRASLKVHSRTHSGEKPFRCADCGKQFSQLRNYKYHRSVHEGTREFAATCPECGKYFNDRGYLSSHMKIHRNRKEYGCAECGKSFNQRVAYNMHVRIHTGVKPHQCEQCGKAFSRKMLLKQHLRTHSGERPYQCQVCQKAFADRSNMTLHTRLHSGLKPYQCNLCSKAFTKKHHLKTHLNYHTGTKPYACSNCGGRFSQSSNMRTHFKKCIVNNAVGLAKSGDETGVDRADAEGNVALTPPNSDQESSILTPIQSNT